MRRRYRLLGRRAIVERIARGSDLSDLATRRELR